MKRLEERVKKCFEGQALWFLGTGSEEPDVSVIGFKELTGGGKLVLCDVMMNHALENIHKNGKASVLALNAETMESYLVTGTAEYQTSGPIFDEWKQNAAAMTGGKMSAKGIVIVTPETVRVKSPSSENGRDL